MNSQVRRYYRKFTGEEIPLRLFHDVIPLHEVSSDSWQEVIKKTSSLPKGWFELSRLSSEDRIDFTKEFWLKTLPYVPHIHSFLESFFLRLDDVIIFLTQRHFDSFYESEFVYSLRDGSCFFQGRPPCEEEDILYLKQKFKERIPEDFLAFLRIHNGFSKSLDRGIIPAKDLHPLEAGDFIISGGREVNPQELIPFYESYDEKKYQCFYSEWSPNGSFGNIFYSSKERSISALNDPKKWGENLAFPTFLDWLILYLEGIEG